MIEIGDTVEITRKRGFLGIYEVGDRGIWQSGAGITAQYSRSFTNEIHKEYYDFKLIKKANPVITNDFNIGDKVEIVEVLNEKANYKVGDRATWTDCFPEADFWRGQGMARKWYKFKLVEEKKIMKNDEMNKEEDMQIEERLLDLYEKGADSKLVQEEIGDNVNRELMLMVLTDKKKQLLALAEKKKADREKEEK